MSVEKWEELAPGEAETVAAFNRVYHRMPKRAWMSTHWRGVQVAKPPTDLWLYQEIIHRTTPDLIIETGTFAGGSARFFADLMDLEGSGSVVTVDVTAMGWAKKKDHHRVEFLMGKSTDEAVYQRIQELASSAEKVMVVLDSDHSYENVKRELELYAPLVTPSMYLVVEDTVTLGSPLKAVEDFLESNEDFVVDRECDKYMLSFSTGGFLRRLSSVEA